MKKIFQFITAIAIVVPIVDSATSEPSSSQTEHVSPFACNGLALSPEVRKRHFEELGPALLKLKKSTRELPDGYEFELPADNKTYQLLMEWAFQNGYAVRSSISTCASTEKADRYGYVSLAGPGLKSSLRRSLISLVLVRSAMPRVSTQEFERLPLRVHTFLAGVPLHDVWSVDLPRWRAGVTLDEFLRTANNGKLDMCGCSKSSCFSRPPHSCACCSTFVFSLDGSSVGIASQRQPQGKASQRV